MRIEIVGPRDYQGRIKPDGFDLYISRDGKLSGPYHTTELAKLSWETQVQKRQVGLIILGSEIKGVISEKPLESMVEDVQFRLGLLREQIKKLI